MKNSVPILICALSGFMALCSFNAWAAEWIRPAGSPGEWVILSSKEKKPVALLFSQEKCAPCKVLFSRLSSKEMAPSRDLFIWIEVDFTGELGQKLAEQYGVYATPTIVFLGNKGTAYHSQIGLPKDGDVSGMLNAAQKLYSDIKTK
jgi:thiol-disulfide isomerase/thioredoxin